MYKNNSQGVQKILLLKSHGGALTKRTHTDVSMTQLCAYLMLSLWIRHQGLTFSAILTLWMMLALTPLCKHPRNYSAHFHSYISLSSLTVMSISSVTYNYKVNWVGTLFSASRGAHILFTSDWAKLYSIYNVAVRGSPVLRTTSLLPSQPKPVPIYTPGSRGAT